MNGANLTILSRTPVASGAGRHVSGALAGAITVFTVFNELAIDSIVIVKGGRV